MTVVLTPREPFGTVVPMGLIPPEIEAAGSAALKRSQGRCECEGVYCPAPTHRASGKRCTARLGDLVAPVDRRLFRVDETSELTDPDSWFFFCALCIENREDGAHEQRYASSP